MERNFCRGGAVMRMGIPIVCTLAVLLALVLALPPARAADKAAAAADGTARERELEGQVAALRKQVEALSKSAEQLQGQVRAKDRELADVREQLRNRPMLQFVPTAPPAPNV